MKYKKKPVVIEAMEYTARNYEAAKRFCPSLKRTGNHIITGDAIIPTLEGEMEVRIGDIIIKGVQGEFYPCKPDIFEQTYDAVEDAK